jgi:hypothetical protein
MKRSSLGKNNNPGYLFQLQLPVGVRGRSCRRRSVKKWATRRPEGAGRRPQTGGTRSRQIRPPMSVRFVQGILKGEVSQYH